jgi:hypothetical protein
MWRQSARFYSKKGRKPEKTMKNAMIAAFVAAGATVTIIPNASAQASEAPYGTAKFSAYQDIDGVKQFKVVWDHNFADPKAVGVTLNNLGALLHATSEFGPKEVDPLKVVIVSHVPGRELRQAGVRFEICRNAAAARGFAPEDLHGFVTVVPAGPYALAYWQTKGCTMNAVGATVPNPPVSELNRADIDKK